MKFTCCGADPESNDYFEAVADNCSCSTCRMPPCGSCENSGVVCAICGSRDFEIDDTPARPKHIDDYDRAMGIFD